MDITGIYLLKVSMMFSIAKQASYDSIAIILWGAPMAEYLFDIIEVEYPPGPYVLLDVNVSDGRQLMTEKEIDQHIDMCIRELNALRKKAKQSLKKLIKSKREISDRSG